MHDDGISDKKKALDCKGPCIFSNGLKDSTNLG